MPEIIERISGWTDQNMIDRCLSFKRVLGQTKQMKTGIGRAVKYYSKPKYEGGKEAMLKVEKSIEHYEKLNKIKNMTYTIEDIAEMLKVGTFSNEQEIELLLAMDSRIYSSMGTDSTPEEKAKSKEYSKKIYELIKEINPEQGNLFLKLMDQNN